MKRLLTLLTMIAITQSSLLAWAPQGDKLKTRWAADVTPQTAWRSYPRPQLQRTEWQNLNGLWNYAVTTQDTGRTAVKYEGEILVPYAIESSLSGVQRTFLPTDMLWYKRQFTIDKSWKGKDIILNFCAVDYECKLWINGQYVGSHKGGNNPFSFDITKFVKVGTTPQTIEMSVVDPTDTESISRGKQQLNQQGIWYTPVSGIWQTVWLECVESTHIKQVLPTTDIKKMSVTLDVDVASAKGSETLRIEILDGEKVIKTIDQKLGDGKVEVAMPNATLWSPATPQLYHLNISLMSGKKVLDSAKSYFAMREVKVMKDECGYNRIALNGEPIFQYGTLDQGWWPDGLLTPPSEEAMIYDMVKLKEMGFNTIRKHIKVEPEQYYYAADSLGIMLWQDMVSGFSTLRKSEEHIGAKAANDWVAPAEHSAQWQGEMFEMIDRLRFYQSITSWVVFNEGWGQHNTVEIVEKVMDYDKSRIIDGVTGWTDRGVGHMYDVHNYPVTSMIIPEYNGDRISVLGEFGGYGWAIDGHLWAP
ncbi:MAG: beta-galactosidase, partial [Rikenellaceae bacterium]